MELFIKKIEIIYSFDPGKKNKSIASNTKKNGITDLINFIFPIILTTFLSVGFFLF